MAKSRIWAYAAVAATAGAMVVGAIGVFGFGASSPASPGGGAVTLGPDGDAASQARLRKQADDPLQASLAKQNEEITRLTTRLGQLERELRSAPTRAAEVPADQRHPLGEGSLVGDTLAPMTPDQVASIIRASEDESIARDRERIAAIDSNWASEPIDQKWAVRYEDDVREALGSLGSDSVSLTDVSCRASLCKLALNGDSAVDAGDLSINLTSLEPFQNTEFTITKPEGGDPGQMVIYLARPGGKGLSHLAASP